MILDTKALEEDVRDELEHQLQDMVSVLIRARMGLYELMPDEAPLEFFEVVRQARISIAKARRFIGVIGKRQVH